MRKLVHSSLLLGALYGISSQAGAEIPTYSTSISVSNIPEAPTHYMVESQSCLIGLKNHGKLIDGNTHISFRINEEAGRCAKRHSTAIIHLLKDGRSKLQFKFYRSNSGAKEAFLEQTSHSRDMDCSVDAGNVNCHIDPSQPGTSAIQRGTPFPKYQHKEDL